MKRIFSLIFAFSMVISLCGFASADRSRVLDNAELLSESERQTLEQQINDAMTKLNNECEIAIGTLDHTRSYDDEQFAEEAIEIYEYNDFGVGDDKSGIMLLLDLSGGEGNRHWNVLTHGKAKTALTDELTDYIGEQIIPHFASGNLMQGFEEYISLSTQFIAEYENTGKPVTLPKSITDYLMIIGITLGGGVLLALIVTATLRAQLKTVAFKTSANDYVKPGSMKLHNSYDMVLYKNVSRTSKSTDNDNHHNSSSNSSYGGSGGSF